jgi:sulfoxide reductase heme-binding subunit YedZ
MKDATFHKGLILVNGLVPLALLALDGARHQLGANPAEFILRTTGILALVFLVLSLAVTPLRKAFGQSWLARVRRLLGLFSFFYALLHLLAYVWFDKSLQLPAILADLAKRPFITVGMGTFAILLPLALTSNNRVIRWMGGSRWNRLHKLAYVAGLGGVAHYFMLVKADARIPLGFGAVLLVLLAYRVLNRWFPRWTEWPSRTPGRRDASA